MITLNLMTDYEIDVRVATILELISTPNRTNTWKPLPLYDVLNTVMMKANEDNISTVKEVIVTIGLSKNNRSTPYMRKVEKDIVTYLESGYNLPTIQMMRLVTTMFAEIRMNKEEDKEYCKTIYVLNSTNKSIALRIGLGYNMSICSNGMIINSDVDIKKRHTGDIENSLHTMLEEIKTFIASDDTKLDAFIEDMRGIELPRYIQNAFFGNMLEVLPQGVVIAAIKYRDSDDNLFPIDEEGFATVWDLYNWFTEAIKIGDHKNKLKYYALLNEFIITIYGEKQILFNKGGTKKLITK